MKLVPFWYSFEDIKNLGLTTILPLELWRIIFDKKYDMEEYALEPRVFEKNLGKFLRDPANFVVTRQSSRSAANDRGHRYYSAIVKPQETHDLAYLFTCQFTELMKDQAIHWCSGKKQRPWVKKIDRLWAFVKNWYPILFHHHSGVFREMIRSKVYRWKLEVGYTFNKKKHCCFKCYEYCTDVMSDMEMFIMEYAECSGDLDNCCDECYYTPYWRDDFQQYVYHNKYYFENVYQLRPASKLRIPKRYRGGNFFRNFHTRFRYNDWVYKKSFENQKIILHGVYELTA